MTWVADKKRRIGYYEKTQSSKPTKLLGEALHFVKSFHEALDIGCGAGVEAKALAKKGFHTVALDVNADVKSYFTDDTHANIEVVISPIETFTLGKYDFVFAKNSLVFLSPKKFRTVIEAIKNSLRPNGVFAARLWGDRDSENISKRNYKHTFVTKEMLAQQFQGYTIVLYREREENGSSVYGHMKHWHLIDIVVQKSDENL